MNNRLRLYVKNILNPVFGLSRAMTSLSAGFTHL